MPCVFTKVANTQEIPSGTMKSIEVGVKKILVANAQGSFYAMDDKCTHIGARLSKGSLDGLLVTCPWHNAQFDLRDGKNVADAQVFFLRKHCKNIKTYEVKVEGGDILIEQP